MIGYDAHQTGASPILRTYPNPTSRTYIICKSE